MHTLDPAARARRQDALAERSIAAIFALAAALWWLF